MQRVVHSDVEAAPDMPDTSQAQPRRLAGAIAFGGGPDATAPAIDGPRCYEGENCVATDRPTGSAPAVLDQISHNVRWTLIDNLHSVPEDCDRKRIVIVVLSYRWPVCPSS